MIAVLFNPATILLATLCLHWVAFASSGLLSLQVPYLALCFVVIYAATGPRKLAACTLFVRENALWITSIAIYLVLMAVVLQGSPMETMAPRQVFFLIGAIAFAACLARTPRLPRLLRAGALAGLIFFVTAVELLARSIGLSWIDAAARFMSGDFKFVMFSFFRGVFNALDPTADVTLSAATKNAVAVSLLVLALLFRSGSTKPSRDVVGFAFFGLAMCLLLMLNTRSVLIVASLSLMMATAIGAIIRPMRNLPFFVLKAAALLALLVTIFAFYFPADGASSALSDRFAFDDYSSASRVEQFQLAIAQIEKDPITGTGYFEANGHVIHNLFLAAWVHGGIAAFVLVVIFYVAILGRWLMLIAAVTARPARWVLPIAFEWIAPLPILPLFRVWLSGDAGNLFLGEWVAVSAFLGCVLANDRARRRLANLHARINGGEFRPAFVAPGEGSDGHNAFPGGHLARATNVTRPSAPPQFHNRRGPRGNG